MEWGGTDVRPQSGPGAGSRGVKVKSMGLRDSGWESFCGQPRRCRRSQAGGAASAAPWGPPAGCAQANADPVERGGLVWKPSDTAKGGGRVSHKGFRESTCFGDISITRGTPKNLEFIYKSCVFILMCVSFTHLQVCWVQHTYEEPFPRPRTGLDPQCGRLLVLLPLFCVTTSTSATHFPLRTCFI